MGTVTLMKLDATEETPLLTEAGAMLITNAHVDGNQSALGVSLFTPGTVSAAISHEVEELIPVTHPFSLCSSENRLAARTPPVPQEAVRHWGEAGGNLLSFMAKKLVRFCHNSLS